MELLDPRMREEGIQKSVKIVIEAPTPVQKSNARLIAQTHAQESPAQLARQKMREHMEDESQQKILPEAKARSAATTSSGGLKAVASSVPEVASVQQENGPRCTKVRRLAGNLTGAALSEIERSTQRQEHDFEMGRTAHKLELEKESPNIESDKFASVMDFHGSQYGTKDRKGRTGAPSSTAGKPRIAGPFGRGWEHPHQPL
uniref:Putative major vault protein n=1 Tax=Trypanosoma congolense (strain IL3000) TaxID=1068625 RepID=G0UWK6_TRYCI|nr:putative major vault protein [Trypanosoma congolense IL3000]